MAEAGEDEDETPTTTTPKTKEERQEVQTYLDMFWDFDLLKKNGTMIFFLFGRRLAVPNTTPSATPVAANTASTAVTTKFVRCLCHCDWQCSQSLFVLPRQSWCRWWRQ
jgi:hypothetical protein